MFRISLNWKIVGEALSLFAAPLVIASAIEIFKHLDALAWLDAQFAAIVARSNVVSLVTSGDASGAPAIKLQRRQELPPVIIIDDHLFGTYFNRKSPLDRQKLAALINEVAAFGPKVLAIDLDLSPDLGKYEANTPTPERTLYEALCRAAWESALARAQVKPPSGTSCLDAVGRLVGVEKCPGRFLVMIDPFPARDDKTNHANAAWKAWIQQRLGSCLRFASADIVEHSNIASHFDKNGSTLGVVAHAASKGQGVANRKAEPAYSAINVAAFVAAAFDRSLPGEVEGLVLLKPRYDPNSKKLIVTRSGNVAISNNVVFIGGAWGEFDKHVTVVASDVPGVVVHAATFLTLGRWYLHAGWLIFILDVLLGVLLGQRLAYLAERGHAARARLEAVRYRDALPWKRLGPDDAYVQYWHVWKWWGAFVALVAGSIILSWIVSDVAFGASLAWFSPVALILGVSVHALFEAAKGGSGEAELGLWSSGLGKGLWVGTRLVAGAVIVVGVSYALL